MDRYTLRRITMFVSLLTVALWACEPDSDEAAEASDEVEKSTADDEQTSSEDVVAQAGESSDSSPDSDGPPSTDESQQPDVEQPDETGDDVDRDQEDEDEDEEEDQESAELAERPVEEFAHLPFYATGPIAVIDGVEISAYEFNAIAEEQLSVIPEEALETQGEMIRQMLVQGSVVAFLIEREIEAEGIEVGAAEIDEALKAQERLLLQQFGGDREKMTTMLERQGITEDLLREQVERELAAEKLVSGSRDLTVSEAQLRQAYEQYEAQLQQPEQTRARHILLHVDEQSEDDEVRQQAVELAEQLRGSGADFADLAQQHSDCPTASKGGDLGYFTRDQLMPEFTEVAFEMEPDTISDPVRSNLGWHVIRVEDRIDEGGASFDDVREELEMMLQAQKMQEAAAELVQELEGQADIEIHEDNIATGG